MEFSSELGDNLSFLNSMVNRVSVQYYNCNFKIEVCNIFAQIEAKADTIKLVPKILKGPRTDYYINAVEIERITLTRKNII